MYYEDGKIYITQRNLNRLYHKTKSLSEVLKQEGATLLVRGGFDGKGDPVRVGATEHPWDKVIGIDLMADRQRFFSDFVHKFIVTDASAREPFRVKGIKANGLPPILAETPEMRHHRLGDHHVSTRNWQR